jgi:2-iminoacetate synthase
MQTIDSRGQDFSAFIRQNSWEEMGRRIYSASAADVEKALAADKRSLQDFAALVSPAAEPYIEQMAAESYRLTRQRFGMTMQLYIPLYLSSYCQNLCVYCGFNAANRISRAMLSAEQILQQAAAIRDMGFGHLLLVTGEAPSIAGTSYLEQAFDLLRGIFPHISIEVQPLSSADYARLVHKGLNTVYIYQETYRLQSYGSYHKGGNKADYWNRLRTPDNIGQAGVHKIGLGILGGLEDWRIDSAFCAAHIAYLEKRYWQTKYSVSFPRLRPHQGGFQPQVDISDKNLAQLIFAYRLFNSELELSLSTRESPFFRDKLMPLGITAMSAGSKTEPGGYAGDVTSRKLEQFSVSDQRSPKEVARAIEACGLQPVWKDWDLSLQASPV